MSSTLHKIVDKVERMTSSKDKEPDNPQSSNFGPHSNAAANKVDPRIDSDRDGRNDPSSRTGGYGNTQAYDQYGSTTGPGGVASSDTYGSRTNDPSRDDPRSTNTGPHSSNLANKLDPRVDSDRDNRNDPLSRTGGLGNTQTANDPYGQTTGPGGVGSTNTGYGTTGTHTTGITGGTHTGLSQGNYQSPTGPHSSNVANKLDPRVDSDNDGYNRAQGNYQSSTTTGPHSSNIANKLDPRVDSDRDGYNRAQANIGGTGTGTNTYGGTGTGVGTGINTGPGSGGYTGTNDSYNDPRSTNTGPHSSNLLNKLDPRVDSDRDGRDDPTSRTGGLGETQAGHNVQRF